MILRWLITAAAIAGVAYVMDGIRVEGAKAAILAALVLGIVNAVIRPILLFVTLPLNILTLGIFSFVINALLLWLTAAVVPGFEVDGFVPALIGSILISVISTVVSLLFR